jgi:poly(A) polymerase
MKHRGAAPYLFLLALADIKGKTGGENESEQTRIHAFTAFAEEMAHRFYSTYQPEKRRPPLITGDDLITDCHLAPSPLFGRILRAVEESRLSNQISTRQEALELVRDMLSRMVK